MPKIKEYLKYTKVLLIAAIVFTALAYGAERNSISPDVHVVETDNPIINHLENKPEAPIMGSIELPPLEVTSSYQLALVTEVEEPTKPKPKKKKKAEASIVPVTDINDEHSHCKDTSDIVNAEDVLTITIACDVQVVDSTDMQSIATLDEEINITESLDSLNTMQVTSTDVSTGSEPVGVEGSNDSMVAGIDSSGSEGESSASSVSAEDSVSLAQQAQQLKEANPDLYYYILYLQIGTEISSLGNQ